MHPMFVALFKADADDLLTEEQDRRRHALRARHRRPGPARSQAALSQMSWKELVRAVRDLIAWDNALGRPGEPAAP